MPGQRPGAPQQRQSNSINPTIPHFPQDPGGNAGPTTQNQLAEGSPRNQQPPSPAPGTEGPPNPSGDTQVSTTPPTPSITTPSPSAVMVNGISPINTATRPMTSLPEVPASFLTNEFMQSVANSLDDIGAQVFRPEDTDIDFEDFREWFTSDYLNRVP